MNKNDEARKNEKKRMDKLDIGQPEICKNFTSLTHLETIIFQSFIFTFYQKILIGLQNHVEKLRHKTTIITD